MKKWLRIFSLIVALMFFVPIAADNSIVFDLIEASAVDETAQPAVTEPPQTTEELEDFVEPEYQSAFTFPDKMSAVTITPGVDFAKTPEQTAEELNAELGSLMADIAGKHMNSVIINTSSNGQSFYSTDINQTVNKAPIELAIQAAKDSGFHVYLTFDINFILGQFQTEPLQERIDYLALQAHLFTVKYPVNGVILSGYYSSKNRTSFDDYMQNGSGIGFDNWLLDNGAYVFSLVSDAIRKTDNAVPVGIYLQDAWANASTNAQGSPTADSFQALIDGYADTLSYVQKGYADFVMLEAEGSIADASLPYSEFVSWWAQHALAANIPLYVMHDNEKICTDAQGWGRPDELVNQLREADKIQGYKGSAFKSYTSLRKNTYESTDVVLSYYNNTLNEETIDKELTILSPQKQQFTTEEPFVKFMGTFDANFKVYFNGEIIKLNEAGNFYYEEELAIGINDFTIENKGKKLNYRITRELYIFEKTSVCSPPPGEMAVEGSTAISISAIAYQGATVTASINGKKITLQEQEGNAEGYENSSYARFVGSYTVPKGIINKPQNLGQIVIYGSYKGKNGYVKNESREGATVVVNALPEVPNNADGSLMKVRSNNTMVYSYSTSDSTPTPDQARLPAGVLDYVVRKVTYNSTSYYLTLSGKRIKCTEVDILDNAPLGSNTITAAGASMNGADTVLTFGQTVKTPFSMSFGNLSYAGGGNYAVSGFTANSLTITFDYANAVSGNFSLPGGSLFSSATWGDVYESGNVSKVALTLTFSRAGRFGGVTSSYDDSGNLVMRFNGFTGSLSGSVFVIDPGHGEKTGGFDFGAYGHVAEQPVVLSISKLLEAKLQARGATVYRFQTENEYIDTQTQRSQRARQYNPDAFISVHANAVAGSSSTRGVEVWYFTPFSQPLASAVSSSVAGYYKNSVYQDGVNRNRGAKQSTYWVTLQQDFPSIMIETGFVSNYEEAMALNNPTHQNGIADSIVRAMESYFGQ